MRSGWGRTLAAAAAVNLAAGTLFAWSILLPPLQAEFGATPAELSAIFSVSLVVFAVVVLAAGGWADRSSPRVLAAAAAVAGGGGLALAAAAPTLPVLAGGFGVLFGLASGLAYATAVTVATTRFGARRGLAVGIVVGAYAAGPILVAPLGTAAIQSLGWRVFLAALAAAVTGVTLAAAPLLPARAARPAGSAQRPRPSERTAGLWSLWTIFLCATMPGLLAFAVATEILVERGVSVGAAGAVVAAMSGGNLAGRLVAGPLSDRIGTAASVTLNLGLLAAVAVALGWGAGAAVAVVALPLIGVQYGAVSALLPAATSDLVGSAGFGAAYGRVFTSWGLAGVLGPAAGAWLRQVSGGYELPFRLVLVAAAVAYVALARLRPR